MKSFLASLLLFGLCLGLVAPAHAADPVDRAAITAIRVAQDEVLVTVHVPAGRRRVTLESRPRFGRGTWSPRDVKWTEGDSGEVVFRLPVSPELELLRVREEADSELGLPASFFRGLKTFAPTVDSGNGRFVGGGVFDGLTPGENNLTVFTDGSTQLNPSRAVVESDIWKVEDSTVYFFNQQRGLQVISVENPVAPALLGTLPLAVWGEQMYRLPANPGDGTVWLALLAQSSCDQNSEVLLVAVKDGRPQLRGRLPVTGQIRESRLVGDALYLATYAWVTVPPVNQGNATGDAALVSQTWENRTVIAAFDLANPAQPVVQPVTELPVFPNAISATDRFLFVATTGSRVPADNERLPFWAVSGNQAVHVFDLSDPHGAVQPKGVLPTAGRVGDKFKLGLNGSALAVVSEAGNTGRYVTRTNTLEGRVVIYHDWVWEPPRTVLETFSLADPANPARLASLGIVTNETVFGTRFDGDRAYIVTFRRVDPLWIVDLSDPSRPAIRGELEVPGWSNYLHPLGDQLLAMGVENGRAALSLFDVKDPAKPALLSKAFLGAGWSWSEANSDEKALAVFPDAGLVLVPWSGQRTTNATAYFQGMQLVDLDRAAGRLTARGVVDHRMQARRATLLGSRMISVSAQELLAVEVADRDQPALLATLPLAHPAERVQLLGDQLLILNGPGAVAAAEVALASVAAPETIRSRLSLPALPIVGAGVKDGRLLVLQHQPETWRAEPVTVTNWTVIETAVPSLQLYHTNEHVVSVPQPAITNLTQVWREITYPPTPTEPGYTTNKLVWRLEILPQPDLLVTNRTVVVEYVPQPPRRETNAVASTEWRSVEVPPESVFSVVTAKDGRLELAGQVRPALPAGVYGQLKPLWTSSDVVVWTEESSGAVGPVYWRGGPYVVGDTATFTAGDLANPIGVFPGPWWGGWFWGGAARHFAAFSVIQPAAPRLLATVTLDSTNSWNAFSEAFQGDGKILLSHRESQLATGEVQSADSGGPLKVTWWEHRHFLDVVDFADAANPVVRPPVPLAGDLAGVSHDGQLLYTRNSRPADNNTQTNELQVLAYDGVSASLVDTLGLPPQWPSPVRVRANGQVLLGRPAATTNDLPALESWAVTTEGRLVRQASLNVGSPVSDLREFADVLVAATGDQFLFLAPGEPAALTLLGAGARSCALYADLGLGDAAAASGLWLARGYNGLWQVPLQP